MYSVIIQILQAHFIEKEKHFSDPEPIACIIFCSVFQKSGIVLFFFVFHNLIFEENRPLKNW